MSHQRFRTPALTAWRAELAAGTRTAETFDWLWRAACREADALDFEAMGILELGRSCREDAKRLVFEAARREREVA